MSYILDALRRADAERERGRVPSLNSPSAASAPERRPGGQARRTAVLVAAALTGLALASALAWWAWPSGTPAPTAPTASAAATKAPPAPAPTAPAPTNAPATVAQVEPSPAPAKAPVVPLLAPAPPAPAPLTGAPSAEASPPAPAKAAASSNGKTGNSANSTKGAKGAEPAEALPRLADLPAELRAQLPALNLSGATYAENPALRMLIANGKVVQEGQEAAPGVVLEAIGPRSAVLNHRGTRFRVPY